MIAGLEHRADGVDGDVEPARNLAIGAFELTHSRLRSSAASSASSAKARRLVAASIALPPDIVPLVTKPELCTVNWFFCVKTASRSDSKGAPQHAVNKSRSRFTETF